MPMKDLSSRADVERLVDAFYVRVRDDRQLGPIFNDVARVDWAVHLPKMYAFWDAVLFGTPGTKASMPSSPARWPMRPSSAQCASPP